MIFNAIKVEDELPPYPQIVTVLLDGRLPMMAQIRPSDNGPEWWTLGMGEATKIEAKKKCVTHWLKPAELPSIIDGFEVARSQDQCEHVNTFCFSRESLQDFIIYLQTPKP